MLLRQNVALKKVNSKYILKSTLTPQLHRKQLNNHFERCQSWPSVIEGDKNKEDVFYMNNVSFAFDHSITIGHALSSNASLIEN